MGEDDDVKAVEPTPEGEIAQAPDGPPTVHRFPVWVYFLGYVVETGKGRQFGNQVIKAPQPIGATSDLKAIEAAIVAHAKFAIHGIVGNRPQVTIINVTLLGNFMIEETITEKGVEAEEAAEGEAVHADQSEES